MKSAIKFGALLFMAFAACTPKTEPDPGPDPTPGPESSATVTVANEIGATANVGYNLEANWSLSCDSEWFSVSPLSGFEGFNEFTVTVKALNENPRERIGYFDIVLNGTDTPVRISVVQESAGGMELLSNVAVSPADGDDVVVEFLATGDVTADFSEDWAVVANIETGLEDVLLDDNTTVSALKKGRVTLNFNANSEAEFRFGELVLSCAGKEYSVPVGQLCAADATKAVNDWNTPFLRRTLAMRFTATWCGYCPMMAYAYETAAELYPERFVPFTIHDGSSSIVSENGDALSNLYRVSGFPQGIVNTLAVVNNLTVVDATTAMVTGLVEEATAELPSKTAISGGCIVSGNMLYLHGSVAAKEADESYRLHAYIMEDGIVANQTSYESAYPGGNDYVHNYVERASLTGLEGMDLEVSAQGSTSFDFEYDLSSGNFENTGNVYAIIYVTYDTDERFDGSVPNASYQNFGHIVDNVVKIPLNGKVDFEYEN